MRPGIQQRGPGETAHHAGAVEHLDEELERGGARSGVLGEEGESLVLAVGREELVGRAASGVESL